MTAQQKEPIQDKETTQKETETTQEMLPPIQAITQNSTTYLG